MNAELPPFKNGEHNSESTPTIGSVITPLTSWEMGCMNGWLMNAEYPMLAFTQVKWVSSWVKLPSKPALRKMLQEVKN